MSCSVTDGRVKKRLGALEDPCYQVVTALWRQVKKYLHAGYSPEQIAGTLAAVYPATPSFQVSHETIYTAIYAMPRGEMQLERLDHRRRQHSDAVFETLTLAHHDFVALKINILHAQPQGLHQA